MDAHVPGAVTRGLRLRGVDVITAQDDGRDDLDDPLLLDRATELDRALVTQDDDFLTEATRRMQADIPFSGVIYAHQLGITIGRFIDDLTLISLGAEMDYLRNRIEWLPLRREPACTARSARQNGTAPVRVPYFLPKKSRVRISPKQHLAVCRGYRVEPEAGHLFATLLWFDNAVFVLNYG